MFRILNFWPIGPPVLFDLADIIIFFQGERRDSLGSRNDVWV